MSKARRPGAGDVVSPAAAAGQGTAADREEDAAAAGAVTIGQALRAVALSPAGDRPVDHADAAAVQAAEKRATGPRPGGSVVPGGVAAAAQRAAETNSRPGGEEGKSVTTLRDVLGDASAVVPGDRAASFVDAEKVAAASSGTGTVGAGMGEVADALAAAAQMNNEGTPL